MESAEFNIPSEFDENKNIELTFWAKNDTNVNQTRIYSKAISDFEKLYPNIKVNVRFYTDYGKIYNDVITNISTGTTPNVCVTYPDHIATYLTGNNTVLSLDELFDDERYGLGGSELKFDSPKKEEIVPEFLKECAIGDKHYAIPYMRSTEACYVNETYVNKLGYELPDTLTFVDVYGESYTVDFQKNWALHPYDTSCFVREGDAMYYKGDAAFTSRYGIDVSHHQKGSKIGRAHV